LIPVISQIWETNWKGNQSVLEEILFDLRNQSNNNICGNKHKYAKLVLKLFQENPEMFYPYLQGSLHPCSYKYEDICSSLSPQEEKLSSPLNHQ